MFTVEPRKDALESLALKDEASRSLLVLAPSRGGMATRLSLLGKHVFFLDEKTLRDPTKNVRGGNPVLFPSPGKLTSDAWVHGKKRGSMKQHGFARNLPWEVASTSTDGDARATLRLVSNDETRAMYPWDFALEFTYVLKAGTLRIEQRIENRAKEPMPCGVGFHPYFHVKQSEKAGAKIGTTATRAFNNVTKTEIDLDGVSLIATEVDLHLVDHGTVPCTLTIPSGEIVVRGSHEFTRWVIWTVEGKDFVCVEPWTCPGDALNTGAGLLEVEPGQSQNLWVEIERIPAA